MSNCNCSELNDFFCRRKRNCCNSITKNRCKYTKEAYANIYTMQEEEKEINLPGEVVPIKFSDNAIVNVNMAHKEGCASLRTSVYGDYKIDFSLNVFTETSAMLTIAIAVNETAQKNATFSYTLPSGHSSYSASAMLSLSARDKLRLVISAPSPIKLSLSNVQLCAVKLN